jgi:hypothetical protein
MEEHPRWDTYAELEGSVFRNWRRQCMEPVIGTVALCVGRWLELHPLQRVDCSLRWGSREAAATGRLQHSDLKAFVRLHGLPPHFVERMGGQPDQNALEALLAEHRWEARGPMAGAGTASHLGQGPKR